MYAKLLCTGETPKGGRVQYYELSEPIHLGKSKCNIPELMKYAYNVLLDSDKDRVKNYFLNPDNHKIVVISDAWDHKERLVFMGYPNPRMHSSQPYLGYCKLIAGRRTPSDESTWSNRDFNSIKDPEVYLRYLAMLNNKSWEGVKPND